MKDLGLTGIDLVCVVIALFLGVNLLSKELEKKTVYAVLPKPLPRWEFVVGKFLGLAAVMTALVTAMSGVLHLFVLSVGGDFSMLLVRAQVLILLEINVVVAIAVLFSSFSSPYLSAMFTAGTWLIGRETAELEGLVAGKLADSPARFPLEAVVKIIPDFHLFYASGAVVQEQVASVHRTFVSWGFVAAMALYGAVYVVGCLALSAAFFQRRDLT